MTNEIKFKTTSTFLGRNGEFKQTGILATSLLDEVILSPITSKGDVGRAWLSVPKADIPELIQILKSKL